MAARTRSGIDPPAVGRVGLGRRPAPPPKPSARSSDSRGSGVSGIMHLVSGLDQAAEKTRVMRTRRAEGHEDSLGRRNRPRRSVGTRSAAMASRRSSVSAAVGVVRVVAPGEGLASARPSSRPAGGANAGSPSLEMERRRGPARSSSACARSSDFHREEGLEPTRRVRSTGAPGAAFATARCGHASRLARGACGRQGCDPAQVAGNKSYFRIHLTFDTPGGGR